MAELEWTSASFRHPSSCFPLDLFAYVKQIQKQKYGSQPSRVLVYRFPKIRPELIWGEQRSHTEEHNWNKKEKRSERNGKKRRRENKERGGGGRGKILWPTFKTELQNSICFWPKLCEVSNASGLGQHDGPPSLEAAVPGCITSPGT